MPALFTTREIAAILRTEKWRIHRQFEEGTLLELDCVGDKRAIAGHCIPLIVKALRARGWHAKRDVQNV